MGDAEIRVKWMKRSTLDGKPTPDTDQYTDIWNKCRFSSTNGRKDEWMVWRRGEMRHAWCIDWDILEVGVQKLGENGRNTASLDGKPIQDRYIDIWMKYWWEDEEMDDWRGGKEDVRHLDLRHFGTNAGFSSVNGRKDEWLVWKNLDGGMQKLVDETNGRNNGRDGTAILDQ